MAQQKKKKLIPVTDIIAPGVKIDSQQKEKEDDEFLTRVKPEQASLMNDLKFEALRDFGKSSVHDSDIDESDQDPVLATLNNSWRGPKISSTHKKQKSYTTILIASVIGIAILYVVFGVLPRVTVAIVTKKIQTQITTSLTVIGSSTPIVNPTTQVLGEILTEKKTNIFKFPATGKETTKQKAQGSVALFNTYSTAPQVLVANTRLESPEGKVFHLTQRVVIPGAKKTGTVLEPSSVQAEVIADQPGASYNIDPVDKFTIPGFKGSDKYEKFYASSIEAMSGGSDGETTVASSDDIKKSQQDAVDKMKESIMETVKLKMPSDFKSIAGSEQFQVLTQKVDARVDKDNNFSVALEAQVSVFLYKEQDVKNIVQKEAQEKEQMPEGYVEKEGVLSYGQVLVDWKAGTAVLPTTYQATFWKPIDIAKLKTQILGKKETDLKTTVLSLQGIDKLTVSFWPFWVSHVPNSNSRTTITVE